MKVATLIFLVLLLFDCNSSNPTSSEEERPMLIRIVGAKLQRMQPLTPQGESWDNDSLPDIFLNIRLNNLQNVSFTDTIANYDPNSGEIDFIVPVPIEIDRTTSSYIIQAIDDDYDSSIPASVQSNDNVLRFDSDPWNLPYPLWQRDEVTLTEPAGTITLIIERAF